MPKVIKKRAEKKAHKEENISETVVDIRKKIKERQRTLVFSLIAFGAVLLLAGAFFIYNKTTTSKARELEYEGYKAFYGTGQAQTISPQERYKSALEKFKGSYAAKKNPVVLLYIANSYYELGNYDEAVKTLQDLTKRYSDPKVVSLAYYKMAMAYESKNDMPSALDALNKLAGIKDSPLQDMALMESAHVLEVMGKAEEAKDKYKELVSKFPKSALADKAKARLGS